MPTTRHPDKHSHKSSPSTLERVASCHREDGEMILSVYGCNGKYFQTTAQQTNHAVEWGPNTGLCISESRVNFTLSVKDIYSQALSLCLNNKRKPRGHSLVSYLLYLLNRFSLPLRQSLNVRLFSHFSILFHKKHERA